MDVVAGHGEHLVHLTYREPSYEESVDGPARLYTWTYRVEASSPEQAERRALQLFWEKARLSSVGWARELVAVRAVLVRPGEG